MVSIQLGLKMSQTVGTLRLNDLTILAPLESEERGFEMRHSGFRIPAIDHPVTPTSCQYGAVRVLSLIVSHLDNWDSLLKASLPLGISLLHATVSDVPQKEA